MEQPDPKHYNDFLQDAIQILDTLVLSIELPPDIVAGLGGTDPVSLGLPTEEDYIAAYCLRTGRAGIADWNFYLAFNFFRLAAIFHGIKGRLLRGNASSASAAERAAAFPRLARLARESAPYLHTPTLLMLAGRDRIVSNKPTRAFLKSSAAVHKTLIEYPNGAHTLEFEADPERYFADLADWIGRTIQARTEDLSNSRAEALGGN